MRRKPHSEAIKDDNNTIDSESSAQLLNMSSYNQSNSSRISSDELLCNNPIKHGYIMKKSNSWLAYMLPCFYSRYQPRYLVLLGAFLYRFSSSDAQSTKGVPIPIEAVTICKLDKESFEIRTIRKSYLFITETEVECDSWVDAIKQRKLQSIKERMGHASISDSIAKINRKSDRLFQSKLSLERQQGDTINSPFYKDPVLS